jgi:adenylate kinase
MLQVLIEKCIGRRVCKKCGKNYNTADISIPAENGKPEIIMPPLNPPAACAQYMEIRQDDTEEIVKERLRVRLICTCIRTRCSW